MLQYCDTFFHGQDDVLAKYFVAVTLMLNLSCFCRNDKKETMLNQELSIRFSSTLVM